MHNHSDTELKCMRQKGPPELDMKTKKKTQRTAQVENELWHWRPLNYIRRLAGATSGCLHHPVRAFVGLIRCVVGRKLLPMEYCESQIQIEVAWHWERRKRTRNSHSFAFAFAFVLWLSSPRPRWMGNFHFAKVVLTHRMLWRMVAMWKRILRMPFPCWRVGTKNQKWRSCCSFWGIWWWILRAEIHS